MLFREMHDPCTEQRADSVSSKKDQKDVIIINPNVGHLGDDGHSERRSKSARNAAINEAPRLRWFDRLFENRSTLIPGSEAHTRQKQRIKRQNNADENRGEEQEHTDQCQREDHTVHFRIVVVHSEIPCLAFEAQAVRLSTRAGLHLVVLREFEEAPDIAAQLQKLLGLRAS